jgi:hypothetical protein
MLQLFYVDKINFIYILWIDFYRHTVVKILTVKIKFPFITKAYDQQLLLIIIIDIY